MISRRTLILGVVLALIGFGLCTDQALAGGRHWGADYFPRVSLVTHEGEEVEFFRDLVEDKVVVINFIYTTCPDVCPLETARLAEVQQILGSRVGQDIFFYSITIDPEVDTPEVLHQYAQQYQAGPGWLFLTGRNDDITLLRKKLGLYIAEIQDGSGDHNLNIIVGNQATGRWMKRSPFENPYVLARHIGDWLHNWKQPRQNPLSYEDAPELRKVSNGETLFRTRCSACHTIGGGDVREDVQRVGPDLFGVTRRRDPAWLARWLAVPDEMLAEKDPLAMELFAQYGEVPMPNLDLGPVEIADLVDYLEEETGRVEALIASGLAVGGGPPARPTTACCEKKFGKGSAKEPSPDVSIKDARRLPLSAKVCGGLGCVFLVLAAAWGSVTRLRG